MTLYIRANKLDHITGLEIQKENWHASDHRPVSLTIAVPTHISATDILRRAKDVNYEFDPHLFQPKRYLSTYSSSKIENFLHNNLDEIESSVLRELESNDVNRAILVLDRHLDDAHRAAKLKVKLPDKPSTTAMEKANQEFSNYCTCIRSGSDEEKLAAQVEYQRARKAVTKEMYVTEHERWKSSIRSSNPKELWNKIDWKGSLSKSHVQGPTTDDLAVYFESLYRSPDPDELTKIEQLESNTYIPVLDDPISRSELDDAVKVMKKGGYDYRINSVISISKIMAPLLLILLNMMFYVQYPVRLAISLLAAIPKKGNSTLPQNYRGIQMLPAIGAIFDRIITQRLNLWIGVSDVQSAFQKGRSTLHQLFVMRLIINLAKKANITIYIGLFDLEKAFDKVSRYLMLKKLVKLGIGSCMLQALKMLYSSTHCILTHCNEYSNKFQTFSGIRQGAASSALLFIVFIDGLVDFLRTRCVEEPLIEVLHCLLHTDDTAVLSTNRELFVKKCNFMLDYFAENALSLNLSKSAYLIINGKADDIKTDIVLQNGKLEYKSIATYLGAKISDSGSIKQDIAHYIAEKRANVTIKFNNFCRKNILAPLSVKLNVLDSCVSSSLLYACETWGDCKVEQIETLYRQGIKFALSVRKSTNNEIIYLEAGLGPLEIRIKKQQIKFWKSLQTLMDDNPNHHINKLIRASKNINLPFVAYYDNLTNQHQTPTRCQDTLRSAFFDELHQKISNAAIEDKDSKLGAYFDVNPRFQTPTFTNIFELDRITISRYRSGSHNLKIESGRCSVPKVERELRMCSCNSEVQTLSHCLLSCPLLQELRTQHGVVSVEQAMSDPSIATYLCEMERVLQI